MPVLLSYGDSIVVSTKIDGKLAWLNVDAVKAVTLTSTSPVIISVTDSDATVDEVASAVHGTASVAGETLHLQVGQTAFVDLGLVDLTCEGEDAVNAVVVVTLGEFCMVRVAAPSTSTDIGYADKVFIRSAATDDYFYHCDKSDKVFVTDDATGTAAGWEKLQFTIYPVKDGEYPCTPATPHWTCDYTITCEGANGCPTGFTCNEDDECESECGDSGDVCADMDCCGDMLCEKDAANKFVCVHPVVCQDTGEDCDEQEDCCESLMCGITKKCRPKSYIALYIGIIVAGVFLLLIILAFVLRMVNPPQTAAARPAAAPVVISMAPA